MAEAGPGQPSACRVVVLDPEPEYRRVRVPRFLFLGFTILLSVGILLLAIRALQNALAGGLGAVALGGSILSVGVVGGIWGTLGLGRGADSCRVTRDGITLIYRSGRTSEFAWNDAGLRITVFELLSKGRLRYSIATRWPSLNPIPQDLYQAILSEAHSRGLSVTEHTDTLPSGHQLRIRIRATNRTWQA